MRQQPTLPTLHAPPPGARVGRLAGPLPGPLAKPLARPLVGRRIGRLARRLAGLTLAAILVTSCTLEGAGSLPEAHPRPLPSPRPRTLRLVLQDARAADAALASRAVRGATGTARACQHRAHPTLEARRQGLRRLAAALRRLDLRQLGPLLAAFTGIQAEHHRLHLSVTTACLTRPVLLSRHRVAVPLSLLTGEASRPAAALLLSLLAALCRQLQPSVSLRRMIRRLTSRDPVLARTRAHGDRRVGRSSLEQISLAAASAIAWSQGLVRRRRLLRWMRQGHAQVPQADAGRRAITSRRGAASLLAAVLFDALLGAHVPGKILSGEIQRFDYDAFVRDHLTVLSLSPGGAGRRALRVLRPVWGRAGLWVAARGASVSAIAVDPGGPAARVGIRPGDRLLRVAGRAARPRRLEAIRDALYGPPGQTLVLVVSRPGGAERLHLALRP